MNVFEMSSKANKDGKRHFKTILHEIFPDSCIDAVTEAGTQYNKNGITWIEEYCEAALPTLVGKSIRCEFLDEDRTELFGHGETDIEDGVAIFENATMVGVFTGGYITDIEINGETKRVCIGEGELDAACYNNFCKKLEKDIAEGHAPAGSVEIQRIGENETIIYKYGHKDFGRIPMTFAYSGYALLGVPPADDTAKIIELNQKEDSEKMNETDIKALASQLAAELNSAQVEIDKVREECNSKIAEANAQVEAANEAKTVAETNSAEIQASLDTANQTIAELNSKIETLTNEKAAVDKELEEAKADKKIGELNAAIEKFTDEQKAYAQAEIDAFKAAPITSEINTVVDKIYVGIGMEAKKNETVAEKNSANETVDIFGGMESTTPIEEINIY